MTYTYHYEDDDESPLAECPDCGGDLEADGGVLVTLAVAGAVGKGFHSETRCAFCLLPLTDYEV